MASPAPARAVGLSQPAIFRHFPTKGALWLGVAEAIAARLSGDWAAAEARAVAPEERLRALIGAQLTAISGNTRSSLLDILSSRACAGQSQVGYTRADLTHLWRFRDVEPMNNQG